MTVCHNIPMKKIPAGRKRGKAKAKLISAEHGAPEFIGHLKGIVRIVGDIECSIEPTHSWESAGLIPRAKVETRDQETD